MQILNDSTISTREDWFQTYMDLQNAQFHMYPAQQLTRTVSDLVQDVETYRENGVQPIGIMLKHFHRIRAIDYENSVDYDSLSGRLKFENYGYETENGYSFQSALLVSHIENDLVRMVIPQEYVFSDKTITSIRVKIPQLEVDQEVAFGEYIVYDVGILPEGVNTISVQIHVKVGFDTYVRNLQLVRLIPVEDPDATISNFEFPNSCELIAPHGYGAARAYVMYHDPAVKRIINPVIIVEGYDPSSMAYGCIGWRTFSTGKSFNENGEPVLQQLAKMPDLISRLQQEGYDVIAVDFEKSGDRIEKNAATLAKIIQWVQHETMDQKSPVLIGASMGGLICQSAMNLLSQSGCTNCLKVFVSFDSPFHGANVPLSVQELTRFFYDNFFKAQEQYVHKLNTDAAKQMLYYHINETGERNAWKQTYSGYNKKLADVNFCITSSSKAGITYPFNDGDDLLFWEVWNKSSGVEHVDLHAFSKNRFNNMTFQCKVPLVYRVVDNDTIGVKKYVSTTTYSNFIGPNYDNAPGSISNYIGEVLEVIKEESSKKKSKIVIHNGPTAPAGNFHGFVPTVSAIDYFDPNPLSNLKAHNFDRPSNKTPFDRVFFPSTNEFHVFITTVNIAELVMALRDMDHTLGSRLETGSNATFNFCQNNYYVIEDVNIRSGGSLEFNTFTKSNYGNLPGDHYPTKELIVTRTSSCGSNVLCEANGNVIVGGDPSQSSKYKAQVVFRKNSILELESDAVLRIRDSSILIIEEGATFIYHPGAKIYLEGPNAVLEIRGKLQLQAGAVFTFEKGNASQNGFVRFNVPSPGDPNVVVSANTASISFSGNGRADKLVEIAGGSTLFLPYHPNSIYGKINSFSMENGSVEFVDGGKIDAGCPLNWNNMDLKQLNGNAGIGLYTRGQNSINLDNCHFYNFATGLHADNNDLGNALAIDNVHFNYCNVGIESYGQNNTLSEVRFWGCGRGLRLESTSAVVLNSCEFIANELGLDPQGNMGHVRIESGWFLDNERGIYDHVSTPITLECTVFELNTIGIVSNGKVNMSPSTILYGQTHGGGNNTFHLNETGLQFNSAEVSLSNGANNFIHSQNTQVPDFLSGSLWSGTPSLPGFSLNASGNYFTPLPANGISAGSGTLYDLIGLLQILPGNQTPILLNGTVLSTVNTSCFDLQRIYPLYKSEVWVEAPVYPGEPVLTGSPVIKAYPNPTENRILIETINEGSDECTVELYDMQGRKVYACQWEMTPGINRMELSLKGKLEPGIYLLNVKGQDRSYPILRINLQH